MTANGSAISRRRRKRWRRSNRFRRRWLAAIGGRTRSMLSTVQRSSNSIFPPPVQPSRCSSCFRTSTRVRFSASAGGNRIRMPIRRRRPPGCCARTGSGRAAKQWHELAPFKLSRLHPLPLARMDWQASSQRLDAVRNFDPVGSTAVVQVPHADGSFTPTSGHHSGAARRVGKDAQSRAPAGMTGHCGACFALPSLRRLPLPHGHHARCAIGA